MVGHDLGGRPEAVYPEKNAKIPEVVKVNNYQKYFWTYNYYLQNYVYLEKLSFINNLLRYCRCRANQQLLTLFIFCRLILMWKLQCS
jgi:hypothetical protein